MKVHTEDTIALFGVLMCLLFGAAGMGDWVWASVVVASIVFMRRRFAVFAVLTAIAPFAYTTVYGSFTLIGQLMAVISAFLCGASRVKHCRLAGLASCLLPVAAFGLHLVIIRSRDWTMPVAGLFAGSPMLAAWQAGRLNRAKDMRLKAEEERRIMAEHDSDMRARLAVLEEHMRINHEMHDILAHTLTVITVQAESGRTTTARPHSAHGVRGHLPSLARGRRRSAGPAIRQHERRPFTGAHARPVRRTHRRIPKARTGHRPAPGVYAIAVPADGTVPRRIPGPRNA